MVYLLAIGSAILYGAADFTGGLTTRRAGTILVVLLSQFSGLALVVLLLSLLPSAAVHQSDVMWGGIAGLVGGVGVALLYRALSIGVMAVVAPTTAVCAVTIPVVYSVFRGERPAPLAVLGIILGIASIVLVSQQLTVTHIGQDIIAEPRRIPIGVGTALLSDIAIGFFISALSLTSPTACMSLLVSSPSSLLFMYRLIEAVRR